MMHGFGILWKNYAIAISNRPFSRGEEVRKQPCHPLEIIAVVIVVVRTANSRHSGHACTHGTGNGHGCNDSRIAAQVKEVCMHIALAENNTRTHTCRNAEVDCARQLKGVWFPTLLAGGFLWLP